MRHVVAGVFPPASRDLPIVVIDNDNSTLSRQLTRWLDASPGIAVAAKVASSDEALHRLRERTAFGYLVIPNDFEQKLLGGRQATVQWLYSAQFSRRTRAPCCATCARSARPCRPASR